MKVMTPPQMEFAADQQYLSGKSGHKFMSHHSQFRNLPTFEEKPQKRFHHDLLSEMRKGGQRKHDLPRVTNLVAQQASFLTSGCSSQYFTQSTQCPPMPTSYSMDRHLRPWRQRGLLIVIRMPALPPSQDSYSSTTKMSPNFKILQLSFFTSIGYLFHLFIHSLAHSSVQQMLIEYLGPQQPPKALNAER